MMAYLNVFIRTLLVSGIVFEKSHFVTFDCKLVGELLAQLHCHIRFGHLALCLETDMTVASPSPDAPPVAITAPTLSTPY